MSGKQLPEHFGRSAACYCTKQLAETAPVTHSLYAAKWCQQPGFIDPFEVVFLCVRRLRQATYVNVRYIRRSDEKVADKADLSPGLEVYFRELRQDDEVQNDLNEYITRGSSSHLKFVLGKYRLDQIMLFLMKYLRQRGPMLLINYTTLEHLQLTCSRSVALAMACLTGGQIHELEVESVANLGSYLSHTLTVACSHDLFWVGSYLAELWGPLLIDFIKIGGHISDTMTEAQMSERQISFMLRLLEAMPWDSLKRCESLRLTLGPEPERKDLVRNSVEQDRQTASLLERPQALAVISGGEALGALLDSQDVAGGGSRWPKEALNDKLLSDQQAEKRKLQIQQDIENRDYSHEYMHSKEFLAAHAPYGMCPSGV